MSYECTLKQLHFFLKYVHINVTFLAIWPFLYSEKGNAVLLQLFECFFKLQNNKPYNLDFGSIA